MQRLIAMRTNVCSHLGRGVRGGCERSRHTEGQPGVSQREVLRDVCRAAESRREAPAWSGSFGSNACGSSCEPRVAAEYGGPRQCLRGKLRLCSAVGRGRLRRRAGAALQRHGDQHQPTRACRRCAPEVDTSLVDARVTCKHSEKVRPLSLLWRGGFAYRVAFDCLRCCPEQHS